MSAPPTYVLVASPLVGAATWHPVRDELTAAGHDVVVPSVAGLGEMAAPRSPHLIDQIAASIPDRQVVLVGHSAAGVVLPALTTRAHVVGIALVDAQLAPPSGQLRVARGWFLDLVRSLAVDGVLPPWSEWWGEGAMAEALPDAAQREELVAAMPALPLDWFEEQVAVPTGWDDRPCAYVQLSDVYDTELGEAVERGWIVQRIQGAHLDLVTRPDVVATAMLRALDA